MKNLILLFLFTGILTVGHVFAQQQFQLLYHDKPVCYGQSLSYSLDGGYLLSSLSPASDSSYMDIQKLQSDMQLLWTYSYGTNDSLMENAIITVSPQYTILNACTVTAHDTGQGVNSDILIVASDTAGGLLWAHRFDHGAVDQPRTLLPLQDGTTYLCSNTSSISTGSPINILVSRLDNQGMEMWSREWGGLGDDIASSMILTSDDKLAVAWEIRNSFSSGNNYFLTKLDSSGNFIWFSQFIIGTNDACRSLLQTK